MVERITRAMELARQERESVTTGRAAASPAAEAAARAAAAA
jgi:hypothetical protein